MEHSHIAPSEPRIEKADASVIAQMFLERYYKVLEAMPNALYRFYNDQSTLSIHIVESSGSTHTEQASGHSAISEKVMSTIQGAAATTSFVDAQHSAGGGVLLQVCGNMKKQGLQCKFTQSFFLAPQTKGYFVLNDILRVSPAEDIPTEGPEETMGHAHDNGHAAISQVPAAKPAPAPYSPPSPAADTVVSLLEQQPAIPPAPAAASRDRSAQQQQHSLPTPTPAAAPPAASLTYAQRLKQTAGASPQQAAAAAAPASAHAAAAAAPREERELRGPSSSQQRPAAEANGGGVAHSRDRRPAAESTVYGVFCRGLPQDVEVTVDMLEAEFSRYGALLGGRQGITVSAPRFGAKTAQVRFEQLSAMDAALQAEVMVGGKRLQLARLRPDFENGGGGGGAGVGRGSGSGGRGGVGNGGGGAGAGAGGGTRFNAVRGGGERSYGRDAGGPRGDRPGRVGERPPQDRPPRTERPDGGRGAFPNGAPGNDHRDRHGGASRWGPRSGSSSRSQTKEDSRREAAPLPRREDALVPTAVTGQAPQE